MTRSPETESQLKFRITPAMRADLTEAAQRNGRTLNAEIIARLQRSLDASKLEENWTADETANDLAAVIMQAISVVGARAGSLSTGSVANPAWFENSYAYEQVSRGVAKIVEAFRPSGPRSIQEYAPKLRSAIGDLSDPSTSLLMLPAFERIGEAFAQTILNEISANTDDSIRSPGRPRWIARAHRLLALRNKKPSEKKGEKKDSPK